MSPFVMTSAHPHTPEALQQQFAHRVAARLDAGAADLPHDICERLRVARQQALMRSRPAPVLRRQPAAGMWAADHQTVVLGGDDERMSFWGRMASVALAVALVAGLVCIPLLEMEERATEVAKVDAALLTDDLPPEAYADPGFVQFLRMSTPEMPTYAYGS